MSPIGAAASGSRLTQGVPTSRHPPTRSHYDSLAWRRKKGDKTKESGGRVSALSLLLPSLSSPESERNRGCRHKAFHRSLQALLRETACSRLSWELLAKARLEPGILQLTPDSELKLTHKPLLFLWPVPELLTALVHLSLRQHIKRGSVLGLVWNTSVSWKTPQFKPLF